jgi:hypothetical protein
MLASLRDGSSQGWGTRLRLEFGPPNEGSWHSQARFEMLQRSRRASISLSGSHPPICFLTPEPGSGRAAPGQE